MWTRLLSFHEMQFKITGDKFVTESCGNYVGEYIRKEKEMLRFYSLQ